MPGFLVSLLPFGILQSVTDSHLVDVGDVGTEDFILTAQFVHLELEFALAFLHAVEQSVGDTVLHPVELVLVGRKHQIHVAVCLAEQFLLIEFLHLLPLFLHFLDFLPLGLFRHHPGGHDAFHVGLVLLEAHPEAGLKSCPLPVHFRSRVFLMKEEIVPVRCEIPGAVLHGAPLPLFLLIIGLSLGMQTGSHRHAQQAE